MYVSGNAAVTAENVVANSALVRMGLAEPQESRERRPLIDAGATGS